MTQLKSDEPLSELELGGVVWSIGLAVYGIQGLIAALSEGGSAGRAGCRRA